MIRCLSLSTTATSLWRYYFYTSLNILIVGILGEAWTSLPKSCWLLLALWWFNEIITDSTRISSNNTSGCAWILSHHTCRCLLLIMVCYNLFVLIVNQHLIFSILLHIKHLLLLIVNSIMTLWEWTMLLVWYLLLWLLLMILYLNLCSANRFCLINLWRWLTVLLNKHGGVYLINHTVTCSHVHGLFCLFYALCRFLTTIFCIWHSHARLTLISLTHHLLATICSLRLRNLLIIARSNTLCASDMLCIHKISESLTLVVLNLEIMWFISN